MLLSQAADAEIALGREDEAFKLATQAAAATKGAGDVESAAKQFAATAIRFPNQPQSAAFHFEAARMLANFIAKSEAGGQSDAEATARLSERIETILLNQIKSWPAAEQTAVGRQWLIKIYDASDRYDEAARISLQWPIEPDSEPQLWLERIELAGRLWRQALSAADAPQRRSEIGQSGIESFKTLVDADLLAGAVRSAAINEANLISALTMERENLAIQIIMTTGDDSVRVADKSIEEFANDLKTIRINATDPSRVALAIPNTVDATRIIELAHLRLIEDGKADDRFRVIAGKTILRIVEGNPTSATSQQIAIATAKAWTGDWQEAYRLLMVLAADKRAEVNIADVLRQAADLLGGIDNADAKQRAIEVWNRIAGGLKQGSTAWHEAKLSAVEQMVGVGQIAEATKLARYIMLTQPSSEPKFQERYQAVIDR
jgi:hypothetical protein